MIWDRKHMHKDLQALMITFSTILFTRSFCFTPTATANKFLLRSFLFCSNNVKVKTRMLKSINVNTRRYKEMMAISRG